MCLPLSYNFIEPVVLIGVFRRENKPSVLPREEKRAELQKEGELDASRKTKK